MHIFLKQEYLSGETMAVKLYSISELTPILNLHPKTILRFIHEGKIRARKIGRAWMVTEADLKAYCHGELSGNEPDKPPRRAVSGGPGRRVRVSAVVEINEQGSEDASRLSNSLMAMLNTRENSDGKARFDFFYYPEIQTARYVFYGSPGFVGRIMHTFDGLSCNKGSGNG